MSLREVVKVRETKAVSGGGFDFWMGGGYNDNRGGDKESY